MVGEAGGVDAALETLGVLVGPQDGLGRSEIGIGLVGLFEGEGQEVGIGATEAAEGPGAGDELVEEVAGFGGGGLVVSVVFGLELFEGLSVFPGEDFGFGEDAGLEVGGDDAALPSGVTAPEDLRPF